MARGITEKDVCTAADVLLQNGERPTVEKVRLHLGRGSPNTIAPLLDLWWRALADRLATATARASLPNAPDTVAALAGQLWEQALASARELELAALEPERDALAAARRETDAREAAAQETVEMARAAEAHAVAALSVVHERLEDHRRLVAQQADQLVDLTRQRDDAFKTAQKADATATVLRTRLESLQNERDHALEASAAHIQSVEDRAHAEVDRARQEARAARRQLDAAEKSHAARVRDLEAQLAELRSSQSAVVRDLTAEQARRETLSEQLDELRRSVSLALQPRAQALKSARRSRAVTPHKRQE